MTANYEEHLRQKVGTEGLFIPRVVVIIKDQAGWLFS